MSQWLELEKHKNLSKMKILAFASAAHEFRNPLNGIIASLEMLENIVDTQKRSKFLQIAKNCSDLMLYLVKDIMDLS